MGGPPKTFSLRRRRRPRGPPTHRRRLNEHVHLLPHVNRQRRPLERIQHLQHPRIHALGRLPRQRLLRHHIRLHPHELHTRRQVPIPPNKRHRIRPRPKPPRVVLVHIHPYHQP